MRSLRVIPTLRTKRVDQKLCQINKNLLTCYTEDTEVAQRKLQAFFVQDLKVWSFGGPAPLWPVMAMRDVVEKYSRLDALVIRIRPKRRRAAAVQGVESEDYFVCR